MRKLKISIFASILTVLFFTTLSSFAADAPAGGASSGGGTTPAHELYLSTGFIGYGKSSTQFDIAPGFQKQLFWSWLQVGGEVTYQKLSYRGTTSGNILIMGGPTFNFDGTFMTLGVAMKTGSTSDTAIDTSGDDPNGIGFCFIVGRRFALGGAWSLRPSLGVVSTGTTGMIFRPIALSYSF